MSSIVKREFPYSFCARNNIQKTNLSLSELSPATSRFVFYKLLRPERVRMNRKPLSSDAFSQWGRHNRNIHDKEVRIYTCNIEDITQFMRVGTRSHAKDV